jgi:hypothetical protein
LKTRLCFGVAALVALTGCATKATVNIQSSENETFLREKAEFEPNVGKDYWIKTIAFLCDTPARTGAHCDPILTNTKLQTDSLEQGAYGTPYYHVKLGDGRSGYVMAADLKSGATQRRNAKAAVTHGSGCRQNRSWRRVGVLPIASIVARRREALASATSMAVTDRYFSTMAS